MFIWLQTFGWKEKKYSGVTAYFIDATLERQSMALACRRFKVAHNFVRVTELLLEIFTDFQLDSDKLIAALRDKGSNFVWAFNGCGFETKSLAEFESDVRNDRIWLQWGIHSQWSHYSQCFRYCSRRWYVLLHCFTMLISSAQKLSRLELKYYRPIVVSKIEERFEEFFIISCRNAEKAVVASLTQATL